MIRARLNIGKNAKQLRGVAAIEFIIVFPVLLLLFFGMINLSQFISMNRRINTATELVADLVTRHQDTIAATTIDDYFIAVELSMRPVNATQVRVELYTYRNLNGTITLTWSKSSTNGQSCGYQKPSDTTLLSLAPNPTGSTTGNDVVVAVVCMPFTPPSDYPGLDTMFQGLTIKKQMILKPRQSAMLNCTPNTPVNCP